MLVDGIGLMEAPMRGLVLAEGIVSFVVCFLLFNRSLFGEISAVRFAIFYFKTSQFERIHVSKQTHLG